MGTDCSEGWLFFAGCICSAIQLASYFCVVGEEILYSKLL